MVGDRRMCFFFFFNDTATTEIYTLSLHDALPILVETERVLASVVEAVIGACYLTYGYDRRSEEHTSELQSQSNLVCRLLLEKKKKKLKNTSHRRVDTDVTTLAEFQRVIDTLLRVL